MYRIVIADDEPLERLTIHKVILDYLGDSCSITLASNGREAIEAAQSIQADIVLLDIEMPGINGLEAGTIIRQAAQDCRIVFLTAYSEFEYVKRAIDIGADNYILKPCDDAEVHMVLDRVISMIESFREEKKKKSISMSQVKRMTRWIEEDIILSILGGYTLQERLEDTLLELGIKLCSGICMILRSPQESSPRGLRRIFNDVGRMGEIRIILCEYDDSLYVMAISENQKDCVSEVCSEMIALLLDDKNAFGQEIYCALGSLFCQLGNSHSSFYHAHTILTKCSHDQPLRVYEAKTDLSDTNPDEFETLFCSSLLSGDIRQALEHTYLLLDWLCAKQKDEEMLAYQLELHMKRASKLLKEKADTELFDFIPPVFEVGESREIRTEKLERFVSGLAAKVGGVKSDKLYYIRKTIADYIQNRFKDDIFLEQIANEMNYSAAYLSKLFKQYFDKSFVQYLTEVRVEAAKKLLQNPNPNIKDIGAEVGYRDNNYFTKVFRRTTGMSPTEYRESIFHSQE